MMSDLIKTKTKSSYRDEMREQTQRNNRCYLLLLLVCTLWNVHGRASGLPVSYILGHLKCRKY